MNECGMLVGKPKIKRPLRRPRYIWINKRNFKEKANSGQ
jgi:hypothetical protein